jgi:KDO2-lipid IV(A) lauroyltransferase
MIEWIQYAILLSFIRLINIFPFRMSLKFFSGIGLLLYLFDKRHRNVALENLSFAFSDKSNAEIKKIAKKSFKNIGLTIEEIARIVKEGKDFINDITEYEGINNIEKAMKKEKGVIIMSAHLGNWEIGALAIGKKWKFNSVVRPLDNRLLNEFLYKIRTVFNGCVISKKNAMKEILKCLKRNELVAILMDQNTSRDDGIFVDFFGKKACTTPVIALLTLRTGASVIPTFTIREDTGKIRVIFEEEVEIIPSSDYRKDIEKYTAIFTEIIESVIRRYPDQWLWLHRRWKTQP